MEPTVPRMDSTQGAAWLALVSLAELLPHALDAQLTAEAGIINFEYGILSLLNIADDQTLRMNELGTRLRSPAPRLSKAVRRLESKGLVERKVGAPGDARAVHVRMTRAGRRAWLTATPPHIAFARDTLLAPLTPGQLEDLARLLDPILRQLDPELCETRATGGRPPADG